MAMIAVRGEFKQNFVKAAIRIAVIELSTYENVCTQRQREETEREKNKTKQKQKKNWDH